MKNFLVLLMSLVSFASVVKADMLSANSPFTPPHPGIGDGRHHGPGHGPGWPPGRGPRGPGWGPGPSNPYPGYPPPRHPGYPPPRHPGYPPPHHPGYPPPPPPNYYDVYGPAVTVRWQDMGIQKTQKLLETNLRFNVGGQLVNEVLLTAIDNHVQINSALAYLVNGQVVELRFLLGGIRQGQQLRQALDYRSSMRVDRIELNVESPNLLGSRGKLQVHLGMAQ